MKKGKHAEFVTHQNGKKPKAKAGMTEVSSEDNNVKKILAKVLQ